MTARPVLALGLVLAFAPLAPAAELNKYLPDDAEWVGGVEVPRLLDAPAAGRYLPAVLRAHGADGLSALLGVGGVKVEARLARRVGVLLGDPDADRRLLAALRRRVARLLLSGTGNPVDQHPLLIVEGDFGDFSLKDVLDGLVADEALGLKVTAERLGERDLFRVRLPGEEEEVVAVRADKGTLLLALRREDVDRALKRADRERPAVRRELAEAAAKADRAHCVWLVGVPRQPEAEAWRVGGLAVGDGVEGVLKVGARDAQALRDVAADSREGLQTLRLLAEKQARADKRLAPLLGPLRDVRTTTDRLTVELRLTVPGEVLERAWGEGK
jgi:hypothetical protein